MSPRLLTLEQAADYLNVPKAEVLRSAVGRVVFGSRVRYDVVAIDAYLDELRGVVAQSQAENDDSLEAQLERFAGGKGHAAGRL